MEQKQILRIFYCCLLAGGTACFWNNLQDATLMPRILFAFIWVLAAAPFWYKLFWDKAVKATIPDMFFVAYVVLHAISIAQAINKPEAVFETQKIFMVFICYLLFRAGLLHKIVTEDLLLKTLAIVCTGYAIYSISQLTNLMDTARPEGDNLYAINALAGHKNLYSGFLLTTSCLLAILVIDGTRFWKYFAGGIILFQLCMILLLQTRSVFLALIAAGVVLTIGVSRLKMDTAMLKKIALPAGLVLLAGGVFFVVSGTLTSVLHRLNFANYFTSDTGAERLVLWYKSAYMLRDHWFAGVGARNWTLVNSYYTYKGMFRMMYLNMSFLQPHNDFIWVWCELGIFGLIAFVGLFVSFIRATQRALKSTTQFPVQLALLLLMAQQVGFMVFSFFDFPRERMEHQMLLALTWAIIAFRSQNTGYAVTLKPIFVKGFVVFTILVFAFGTYTTFVRLKADSYVNELLAASEAGDSQRVIDLAKKMNTPFSNLTPIYFPKKWYEGVGHYALRQYDEAYACFLEAKKQAPYNPNVLNNLGGMQTYFKHYDDALLTYKETLRINEKNDDARFNTAFTLYQLGRYQEALDSVEKVWSDTTKRKNFERIITAARDSVNK